MMADEVKEIIKKMRQSSGYRSHVTKFTCLVLDFQEAFRWIPDVGGLGAHEFWLRLA